MTQGPKMGSRTDVQQHADGTWKLSAYSILSRKSTIETMGNLTVRSSVTMAPNSDTVSEYQLNMEQARVACEAGGKDVVSVAAQTLIPELPSLRSDDPNQRRASVKKLRSLELNGDIQKLVKRHEQTSGSKDSSGSPKGRRTRGVSQLGSPKGKGNGMLPDTARDNPNALEEADPPRSGLAEGPRRYQTADKANVEAVIQRESVSFNKPWRGPLDDACRDPLSPKSARLSKTWGPGSPRSGTSFTSKRNSMFVPLKPVYDIQKVSNNWRCITSSGQGQAQNSGIAKKNVANFSATQ